MAVEFPGYKDNRVYFSHGLYGLPESHYSLPGEFRYHFTHPTNSWSHHR